jgi:NADPH:quinone reductase-like Zn-dependent oxidoreductase
MRRLQLTAHGEPTDTVELHELDEPVPGPQEVLVAMEAAPLNPSDFMLVRGAYRVDATFPFPLGSEGVGRIVRYGSDVDSTLAEARVLVFPNHEQGTWAERVVVPVRNLVPLDSEADPIQLSMIGINALTAYLLLSRYVSLMPGDWIGQTAANSAMGEYIGRLARLAGVKTLNVVRRPAAVERVRQFSGDRVVVQGDNLHRDIEGALGGKRLRLVLDCVGGAAVGELAKWLKPGDSIASYGIQDGQWPAVSPYDLIFQDLTLHGFSVRTWMRNAPRTVIGDIYQTLGHLVAEGSLSTTVDSIYPLDEFKDAFAQSFSPSRDGKVLFSFGGNADLVTAG